jgi:hypothetical protein
MDHRIGLTRAIERRKIEAVQPMVGQFQTCMLARHEQIRRLTKGGEGAGDWTEFDGLRARSYNERNTILTQPSP